MDRRKFLKATGVASLGVGLAGCFGQNQGDGNETPNDGDDQVQQGGQDQDSWFNLKGEVANDSQEQLKFKSVNLVQIAGGDQMAAENGTGSGSGDGDGNQNAGGDDGGIFSGNDASNAVAGVNGRLKNTADQAFEDVQVTATLYDQNDPIGQFIDSTEARNRDYLREDGVWPFTIVFDSADIDQATRYTVMAEGDLADQGTFGDGGNQTDADDSRTPGNSGGTESTGNDSSRGSDSEETSYPTATNSGGST